MSIFLLIRWRNPGRDKRDPILCCRLRGGAQVSQTETPARRRQRGEANSGGEAEVSDEVKLTTDY
jgi:hypothetical protein